MDSTITNLQDAINTLTSAISAEQNKEAKAVMKQTLDNLKTELRVLKVTRNLNKQ